MAINILFLVLVISLSVTVNGQECVTYDFEDEFSEYFDSDRTVCNNFPFWNTGYYNETNVEPPFRDSYTFVFPNPTMSCASSFEFPIDTSGRLEINVVMESANVQDQIVVLVQGVNVGANDVVLGQGNLMSLDGNPISTGGLYTIPITWTVTGIYSGYVALMGLAAEESIVLVDSFRYIPPGIEDSTCVIYGQEEVTSTTEVTTETTTEIITEITTEPTTELTTEISTEVTTDVTTQITTDETPEFTTESTTEATTEATNEVPTEATPELTTETTTTEVTPESTTETTDFTTEETTIVSTDPTTEETTEITTEGIPELTTESTPDFTTEEITELTTETTIELTTEDATETTTEAITEQSPELTTEGPESETTTDSAIETTQTPAATDSTLNPDLDTTEPTNTDNDTAITEGVIFTTERPSENNGINFWNPLTIATVTILSFIVFCLICWYFFECGRRKAMNEIPLDFVYDDIEEPPSTIKVPRITRVYTDTSSAIIAKQNSPV